MVNYEPRLPSAGDGESIAAEDAKLWDDAQESGDFTQEAMTEGQQGWAMAQTTLHETGLPLSVIGVCEHHGVDPRTITDGFRAGIELGIQAFNEGVRL